MRLFYDNSFSIIENETWNRMLGTLKTASYDTLNVDLFTANLIKNNKINLPRLGDEKKITSGLNLEDGNGKVYEPNLNAEYRNSNIVAVATFRIPFSGEKNFFNIKPSNHVEVGYNVEFGYETLVIKIPTQYVQIDIPEKWSDFIRREIIAVKTKIEENLMNLENDVNAFELILEEKIKTYINDKKVELNAVKIRNSDINPFN